MNNSEANTLIGRVLNVDGSEYTVASASTYGNISVFDPRRNEYIHFDSLETFEHWAYGKPVSATTTKLRASIESELIAALKAWEHWYSVDSTEFNRETARGMGLKAIEHAKRLRQG